MAGIIDLSGKHILLAGGLSDVGKVITNQIICLGGEVTIVDNHDGYLPTSNDYLNNKYNFVSINLHKVNEIEQNITKLIPKTDMFHGLVFCSGIGGLRPLTLTKPEYISKMMDVNFISFVELTRSLIRRKAISHEGSIVAISSISSIKGLKGKLAYASSKAALNSAVLSLAAELGEKHIRVNAILKGALTSDMQLDHVKNMMALGDDDTLNKQFLGKIEPNEISNLVCFLLSDAVKSMTGTCLNLDGGYSL